jgi:hypothetical protein
MIYGHVAQEFKPSVSHGLLISTIADDIIAVAGAVGLAVSAPCLHSVVAE